jgi:hypothetical protein
MSFNTDEMTTVGDCVNQALKHQFANTFGATKEKCMTFVYDLILRGKPTMLLTDAGLDEIITKVFGDAEIRDFVLELTYSFSVYWAGSESDHSALATVMAQSVGVNLASQIPKAIAERMVTVEQATRLLAVNKWLVMLLLLFVWVEAPEEVLKAINDGKA